MKHLTQEQIGDFLTIETKDIDLVKGTISDFQVLRDLM
jgi:hypothetical protein